MKIPFKWSFLKGRKLNDKNNARNINNIEVADDALEFREVAATEKDTLLAQLDSEKVETIFFRAELDKDSISLEFVRKLASSPSLLDYLANNVFDGDVIKKINDNNLRVSDIQNYDKDWFQYDVFSDVDKEIVEIFRKNVEVANKGYANFSFEDFQRYMANDEYVDSYVDSLVEGQSLLMGRTKAVPLDDTQSPLNVMISIPLESDKIFCKDIFDFYYSGDLTFNEDTILFISYEQFLEWIKDDEKAEILKQVQVVFNDNYSEVIETKCSMRNFKYGYSWNFSEDTESDKLLVQVNHLLYLLDKSELDNGIKEYYQYCISSIFKTIEENTYSYGNYHSKEKLRNLAREIKEKLDGDDISKATKEFNQLGLETKKRNVEQVKFSVEIFLRQFDNFEEMKAFDILKYVSSLNKENRNVVLTDERIVNKLRGLLKESSSNEYRCYEEICNRLNISEIFKIFDSKFIKCFYKTNRDLYQYRFFYTLMKSNVNEALNYLLDDDEYFKELLNDIDKYYFSKLDYSLLIKMLKKIEQSNLNVNIKFVGSADVVNQFKLLKEDFSNDFLVRIVRSASKEVQQFFYLEDKRFNYLWEKFDILKLSSDNYKFSDNVVSKPEFFDRFKSTSMVLFRANVNQFLIHQQDIYFEEKIEKYEDELISNYDESSGLFAQYKYLIENINFLDDRNFAYKGIDFFYDANTNMECRKYIGYDEDDKIYIRNKEGLTNYLKWLSKAKLNEVIIDRLFKDNIYNVFLNINEMLRYNKGLSENEKVLSQEQVDFYETIVNIDRLDKEVILEMYRKFKDKNVALMFYEDLRNLKDKSYDKIKEDLFQPENMNGMEDEELSDKYGVPVFDLRDKEYVMLARCLGSSYGELSYHKRDCYTLLSSDNSTVFHDNDYKYGYSGFDNDCILSVSEGDAFSADVKYDPLAIGNNIVNRIMTSQEIVTNSSLYSEIQIVNKKSAENEGMFDTLRPSFLIVYDEIDEKNLAEAKRKNIPICIISHVLNKEVIGDFDTRGLDEKFKYTREWGINNESERRKSR